MHSKLWSRTCNYTVPKLLVLEFWFLFHFRGDCVWFLFHMQGMFAILKLFLFAIKVVMDQEQSNGRSPSGRAYWVPASPVRQAASARKALLPPPQWAGALSFHRTPRTHTYKGWEARRGIRVLNSLFNCAILGHIHCCFIHDDGQYPFSVQQIKAEHVSLKAWFVRLAKLV